ncbi:cytochrome c oxidase subunit VB-domain-containing protein [Naematelia encephala]|uniref:Cytochrome c oxidase subunit VB-domain-containing protein n=1 Tax=Naematelia encephala TaxID=71784 RepID=A0A1Y2BDR6_9TREE|nr:cytochrome c oxidase subunit VB-domain-containing protein [Naematelia encephala]
MASLIRSLRFVTLARHVSRSSTALPSFRAFSTSALRKADDHGHGHPAPPQIYGPGGKRGEIPTDADQATGIERFELIADAVGVDAFDWKPIDMTHMGTLDNPIEIFSLDTHRYIGCTGYPADSHDTIWMRLNHAELRKRSIRKRPCRCPECGCVYELKYHGPKEYLEEQIHDLEINGDKLG